MSSDLLLRYFMNRMDCLASMARWRLPAPIPVRDTAEMFRFLEAHTRGHKAEAPHYAESNPDGIVCDVFRVGSYSQDIDGSCRWLCLDFDGPNHKNKGLDDPLAHAEAAGLQASLLNIPIYLEMSHSGKGWHQWVFFEEPVRSWVARKIARRLLRLPPDGAWPNGIDIFPKSDLAPPKRGCMVWLPFSHSAAEGCSAFYRDDSSGGLVEFVPDDFRRVPRDYADALAGAAPLRRGLTLAEYMSEPPPDGRYQKPKEPDPNRTIDRTRNADDQWTEWRRKAIERFDLRDIYGDILTGRRSKGWLQARDMRSKTGDRTPSASVADGSGRAQRGRWVSQRDNKSLSVIDYLMEFKGCSYNEAVKRLAESSGVPLPEVRPPPPESPGEARARARDARAASPRPAADPDEEPEPSRDGAVPAPCAEIAHQPSAGGCTCGDEGTCECGPACAPPADGVLSDAEYGLAEAAAKYSGGGDAPPDAPNWQGGGGGGEPPRKPAIRTTGRQLDNMRDDAWRALLAAEEGNFYCHAGALTRLRQGRRGIVMEHISKDVAYTLLWEHADWFESKPMGKNRGIELVDCKPPHELASNMVINPHPSIRTLAGISMCPQFDASGRLVEGYGYDSASGLWIDTDIRPKRMTIEEAMRLFRNELFVDFKFQAPSDQTHAYAEMLLPIVRRMIDGCTPLHLNEAPTQGSGKTLVLDIASIIATGQTASPTTMYESEDSNRKFFTAELAEGAPIVGLDNQKWRLTSPSLATILTARYWKDRILNHSKMTELPNDCMWVLTANNLRTDGDFPRRMIRVRIDPQDPHPSRRSKFRHEDLIAWATQHRAELLGALVCFVQHWQDLGCPPPPGSVPKMGKFERWRHVVGGILSAMDMPAFLGDRAELEETTDIGEIEWHEFVEQWNGRYPVGRVAITYLSDMCEERNLLGHLLGRVPFKQRATVLARAIADQRGRIYGSWRMVTEVDKASRRLRFGLERIGGEA